MREIAPGIVHWQTYYETIRSPVSSYLLVAGGVVLDPRPPDEGFGALAERFGEPRDVILTNRHHYRQAAELETTFGATDLLPRGGHARVHARRARHAVRVRRRASGRRRRLRGRRDHARGDRRSGSRRNAALAFADGLVRMPPDGPLGFVPDRLLGDDPEGVKHGLHSAFARLAALSPEHLLLAHGLPVVGGGCRALEEFAES